MNRIGKGASLENEIDEPSSRVPPVPAWPSVTSLDAVVVAIVWQEMLMRCFGSRSSTWSELAALGGTVWLIYVADRLLDATKLDLTMPHSLRHRFYRRHARVFLAVWVVVLAVDTVVVVNRLPAELIRGGLLLSAGVLIYGAGIHFRGQRSDVEITKSLFGLPKEIRVGVLFACGVSLTTWTHLLGGVDNIAGLPPLAQFAPLLATTIALAILFTSNCMLVAWFERRLDAAQSFTSIMTNGQRSNENCRGRRATTTAVVAAAVIAWIPIAIPTPIRIAITACALGLWLIAMALSSADGPVAESPRRSLVRFDVRGVWVDVALCVPAALMLGWLSSL